MFMLRVLDETLTYEVDQIRIVLPTELSDLEIEAGKDYCTLVTCTPYGINTHRLLVRGHRIENVEAAAVYVTADAIQIEPAAGGAHCGNSHFVCFVDHSAASEAAPKTRR